MNFTDILSDTTFFIVALVVFTFALGVFLLLASTPRSPAEDDYAYRPITPIATDCETRPSPGEKFTPLAESYEDERLTDRGGINPSRPWPRFTVTRAPTCDEPMGYEAGHIREE